MIEKRVQHIAVRVRDVVAQHGRSTGYIDCPFCSEAVLVFLWSLAGGGKRCACGAKFARGMATKVVDP